MRKGIFESHPIARNRRVNQVKAGDLLHRVVEGRLGGDASTQRQDAQPAEEEELEYLFKGILPITEIVNQLSISQTYPVELQLICEELRLEETIAFQMTITRPGSGSANYRIFTFQGKMYNEELQLPAFEGFDNEIDVWIIFNAYINN